MAVSENITHPVNSSLDEWASEASTLDYVWNVMGQAGNLSLDIARSVLEFYSKFTLKAKSSGRRRQIGGYIQCPRCSTPWIAGFCQPRLLGFPRSVRNIKYLLKRKHWHPRKLSSVERMKLNSFHSRQNVIEMTCLICKHKMREFFSVPVKEKIIVKTKPEVTKRKKKVKEVNAGLHLSFVKTQSNTSKFHKSTPFSKKCITSIQEKKFSTDSSEDIVKLRNKEVSDTFMKSKFRENESMHLVKTSSKRAAKSTVSLCLSGPAFSAANSWSKSAEGSRLGSRPGSRLSSRPERLHHKEMREKQMQLSGLKKAALKDINRHSNDNKNSTLSDFLNSLI